MRWKSLKGEKSLFWGNVLLFLHGLSVDSGLISGAQLGTFNLEVC